MDYSCKSILDVQYQIQINYYPPELQTSGAVLFAIVNSVSCSSSSDDESIEPQVTDCHHFVDGQQLDKLQIQGPHATFLSLIQQSRHTISANCDSYVVEYSDCLSMRIAKASDFINESTGNIETTAEKIFNAQIMIILGSSLHKCTNMKLL